MQKLSEELQYHNAAVGEDEFKEILADTLAAMFPSTSDAWLVHNPRQALDYCAVVRHRSRSSEIPDEMILRRLENIRKAGP